MYMSSWEIILMTFCVLDIILPTFFTLIRKKKTVKNFERHLYKEHC